MTCHYRHEARPTPALAILRGGVFGWRRAERATQRDQRGFAVTAPATTGLRLNRAGWRDLDRRIAAQAGRRGRLGVFAHELVWFGIKQAWACLFGALMLALLIATWMFWPAHAPLARYDFVTLAAVAIQVALLGFGLETRREALVIVLFHVTGTTMELFKTATGSWVYPGPSILHVGGVPLFTGFMYASVGSYIARAWRLFEFRFTRHPPWRHTAVVAIAIYANFFTDHFGHDFRLVIFAAVAWLFWPTEVHFRVRHRYRRMPLLLGFALVAMFIWFAENLGTITRAWYYPAQHRMWHLVPPAKIGSWLLLMIISYVMVSALYRGDLSGGDAD
jgi:uncharacterized membrane protein YoaT (DUF817 family)